ncbi:coumaroyl-CoA:anthocyanidin 3-O-glucoside-6''-O-coumaroyltransferase 1-like [Rutidosis leptorrhynchoides]|uniref:coumaroyl-CoA:anthocyanidin 3-O-glucoside-6''-O-coumaroyltransferase 1-like n=1 Tax=Rutidosis leptorrhynchoides TaxID=125765 RepID=UPI003A99551B
MGSKVKVMDEFQVSPPPGSLPTTISLPLTYFDLPWLCIKQTHNMRVVYFYTYPEISLEHFNETLVPSLKSSLSLTLQHFFPLVSNLILPPAPQKPYILYEEGNSISFTVAECSGDFDDVISDRAKDVTILHPFAPRLLYTRVSPDGTGVNPLLAVQVTLFPNKGVCIGIEFHHVAADGRAFLHFTKSWASTCRSNDFLVSDKFVKPSFDRSSIEDPYDLEARSLKQWRDFYSRSEGVTGTPKNDDIYKDKVRSTFALKSSQIKRLKQYFSDKSTDGMEQISSFVVTCSFSLVCMIKSLENIDNASDKFCCLCFGADCRNRFGISYPENYFGNCLLGFFPRVPRNELVGDNGLIVATQTIGNCIKELKSNGTAKEMDKWTTIKQGFGPTIFTSVAGSPYLGIYKTDFGWGCPKKKEVIHIDLTNTIYIVDSRDDEGGIEIQLALKKREMEAFTKHFEECLNLT